MKNVLLLVHDDAGQEARLQAAVDVVRAFDGNLTCLDVTETPDRAFRSFAAPIASMVLEQAAANERRNKAALLPRLEAKGIEPVWIDAAADLNTVMIEHGRLADLVVINTLLAGAEYPDMPALARALVSAVHAPVLAVPAGASEFRANGHAVVCWDGSSDAEAALCAAVPLLTIATQVTIMQVGDPHGALPAREAAEYLRKHDIIAHTTGQDTLGSPGTALDRYFRRHMPSYAVMGAFGQGRVREALFGSVTAHLLAHSPIPLLIARHV